MGDLLLRRIAAGELKLGRALRSMGYVKASATTPPAIMSTPNQLCGVSYSPKGGSIILAFEVGLHVDRWHQAYGVTERLQLTRPKM